MSHVKTWGPHAPVRVCKTLQNRYPGQTGNTGSLIAKHAFLSNLASVFNVVWDDFGLQDVMVCCLMWWVKITQQTNRWAAGTGFDDGAMLRNVKSQCGLALCQSSHDFIIPTWWGCDHKHALFWDGSPLSAPILSHISTAFHSSTHTDDCVWKSIK